jgi:hypothetical protein
VRTAKEALQALHEAVFDIVLKNHDPAAGVNACRFLRKAASSIPVVGEAPAAACGAHGVFLSHAVCPDAGQLLQSHVVP